MARPLRPEPLKVLRRWGRPRFVAVACAVVLGCAVLVAARHVWLAGRHGGREDALLRNLGRLQAPRSADMTDCAAWRANAPLVLLILGQSNAGNHGAPSADRAVVRVQDAGRCALAADPLPGATGDGGSIWSLLPAHLQALGMRRPVVLQLLAVDGTSVGDWVAARSPLRARLQQALAANHATALVPNLVLWQQGEADAITGTPPERYKDGLSALATLLSEAGVHAPILLARSTVCRSAPSKPLQTAAQVLAAQDRRFSMGPDTDALTASADRYDGCHLTAQGRERAAAMWAQSIGERLAVRTLSATP